ncbi:MAG: trypsin-like peptidase domain-containing protein [Chthoniobacterales bacterium]
MNILVGVGCVASLLLVQGSLLSQQMAVSTGKNNYSQKPSTLNALALNDAFADVYDKASPSVVVIEVLKVADSSSNRPVTAWDYFFRKYQDSETDAEDAPFEGSGFIISSDGLIVTNYHVVRNAREQGIKVSLHDERSFTANLVGADPKTDIALLQIDAMDLPAAELGDSDTLRVGNFAFAIGAPFDLPYTFTYGIVSAKGRERLNSLDMVDFIQTDASINPGNSGGPLVDIHGRVVGINTLIYNMNRGLGFAVPVNLVKDVVKQIVENGRVIRPWLGISILGLQEQSLLKQLFPQVENGVLINAVRAGTPAYKSDLRPGDLIVEVDGKPVATTRDVQRLVMSRPVGDSVKLKILRGRQGRSREITIVTEEQPGGFLPASNRLMRPQIQVNPHTKLPTKLPTKHPNTLPTPQPTDAYLLGLNLQELDATMIRQLGLQQPYGLLVREVSPDSPAEAAGIFPGDIIVQVGDVKIKNTQDFANEMTKAGKREGVLIFLQRGSQRTFAILKN